MTSNNGFDERFSTSPGWHCDWSRCFYGFNTCHCVCGLLCVQVSGFEGSQLKVNLLRQKQKQNKNKKKTKQNKTKQNKTTTTTKKNQQQQQQKSKPPKNKNKTNTKTKTKKKAKAKSKRKIKQTHEKKTREQINK